MILSSPAQTCYILFIRGLTPNSLGYTIVYAGEYNGSTI